MAVASLQYTPVQQQARASSLENVLGWIWSDPSGWISANNLNSGACSPGPCGTYGVNLDPVSHQLNGFAWSDIAGWVCFGSSCAASASCSGPSMPAGGWTASVSPGVGTVIVHGWAKVCNEGDDGWISLNCADAGAGVCTAVSPYYKVVFNTSTGQFKDLAVPGSSFAWNGTTAGTGFGYMDFSGLRVAAEAPPFCSDGLDNDGNGLTDCQEAACSADSACIESPGNGNCSDGIDNNGNGLTDCQEATCSSAPSCQETPTNGNCSDGIDNNLNGLKDCQETACQSSPVCAETTSNGNVCSNGIDDNGNGLVDCADPGCTGSPACVLSGEPACGLGSANACCSDGVDNDGAGGMDCQDVNCQNQAPICTPAWLQAKYGNVYAQEGISAQTGPGGISISNATYCLTSQGAITGFSSSSTCLEPGSSAIQLPGSSTGYRGTLGSLDISGILAGRYGQVIPYTGVLPAILDGKVYHASGSVTLGATTFQNGNGATQKGSGLLLVEGTLTITGDLAYQTSNLSQYLRNLASLGVIVKKDAQGNGGNIFVQPNVQNLVGAYFAEGTINTGTSGGTDQPLQVLGLLAAHQLNLQRNYHDPSRPAERVILDGRAAANPPPGMQDVSHSLPTSKDAF